MEESITHFVILSNNHKIKDNYSVVIAGKNLEVVKIKAGYLTRLSISNVLLSNEFRQFSLGLGINALWN